MVTIILPVVFNRASLPRSSAPLPGIAHFLALNENPVGDARLGAWPGPKRQAAAHKAFRLSAENTQMSVGKISNIFICFCLSWGFAGQAKSSPTLLVEIRARLLVCCFIAWIKPQLPALKISEFPHEILPCDKGSRLSCFRTTAYRCRFHVKMSLFS